MRTLILVVGAALTASCGDSDNRNDKKSPPSPISTTDPMIAQNIEVGPIIKGRNLSVGVSPYPIQTADGWAINIPYPNEDVGHVGYVTFKHGSLQGKTRIRLKYRIEMVEGAKILPRGDPNLPSIITLYFQRAEDTWSGTRQYEGYRWWATFVSQAPITKGEHEIVAPLTGRWTAVEHSNSITHQEAFQEALKNAERVGFTLGGNTGYGHGIYATGPARLVVTELKVE